MVDPLGDQLDSHWNGWLLATSSVVHLDPLEDPQSAAPTVRLEDLVARLDLLDEVLEANVDENLLGPGLITWSYAARAVLLNQ